MGTFFTTHFSTNLKNNFFEKSFQQNSNSQSVCQQVDTISQLFCQPKPFSWVQQPIVSSSSARHFSSWQPDQFCVPFKRNDWLLIPTSNSGFVILNFTTATTSTLFPNYYHMDLNWKRSELNWAFLFQSSIQSIWLSASLQQFWSIAATNSFQQ